MNKQRAVLNLYRQLLQYGKKLELTDKEYFIGRVRKEFLANKHTQEEETRKKLIQKGEALLRRKRVL